MFTQRFRLLLFTVLALVSLASVQLGSVAYASTPRVAMYTVTLKDNRTTLRLRRGDYVALALDIGNGGRYNWQKVMVDSSYLTRIATTHQGVYTATRAGTTTITALGEPKCYPRCGMPSIIFSLDVVVQ